MAQPGSVPTGELWYLHLYSAHVNSRACRNENGWAETHVSIVEVRADDDRRSSGYEVDTSYL